MLVNIKEEQQYMPLSKLIPNQFTYEGAQQVMQSENAIHAGCAAQAMHG